ncbi:unnamed protein product [Adineta ricciae]|uniref:Uncharacterized protein n=1 Tax=Adineta ricciae TaxID=249248 RepID=A0A816FHT7_ADIRI|nr:unnamed protein product [Adineta ricciae]CAF1661748.1 unnamed protein product [Adineta ricciae]
MPKSRNKKDANVSTSKFSQPLPLLDSIRGQTQSTVNMDNDSDTDNLKIPPTAVGWQCNMDDWSDAKAPNSAENQFPQSLRSLERKQEKKKDLLLKTLTVNHENMNKEAEKKASSDDIDLPKLTQLVTDLITGNGGEKAYDDFLSILQYFSVHSTRDDHLEETVYHLIQAAVSFIRSNQQRFDLTKLDECYRRRHLLKSNSTQ